MIANGHNGNGRMNNRDFAATDSEFREACKRAGIPPTQRQASKFRLGFGVAWNNRRRNEISETEILTAAAK